jgi:ribonuclease Z
MNRKRKRTEYRRDYDYQALYSEFKPGRPFQGPNISPSPSASSSDEDTSDHATKRRISVIHDMFRGQEKRQEYIGGRIPHSSRREVRLPAAGYDSTVISYLIVGPERRGKFLPDKAKRLGVKPGPQFGILTSGKSVTTQNGTIVRPEDCMTPGSPASVGFPKDRLHLERDSFFGCYLTRMRNEQAIFLVECPTRDYIPQLLDYSREVQKHILKNSISLKTIYHNIGEGVLDDDLYLKFMNSFKGVVEVRFFFFSFFSLITSLFKAFRIQHKVASQEFCPDNITFVPAAILQLRLSKADPKIFALPKYSLAPRRDLSDGERNVRLRITSAGLN